MATIIKAGNAASGFSISGDNTGTLSINTGTGAGTTAMTLDASQNVTIAGTLTASGGITNISQIQPITASVAANALTITLNPTLLDFRSTPLTSGTVNTRRVSTPISITVPAAATLATVNAVQSDIVVLAIDNAGAVELAVTNYVGGNNLDETTLINTVAIAQTCTFTGAIAVTTGILTLSATGTGTFALGQALSGTGVPSGTFVRALLTGTLGAAGSTYSTNITTAVASTTMTGFAGAAIYSTTARTAVPFRVVGVIESTQATAGTWVTAPSTIQGAGGNALTSMQSLGYGQTWQDVTTSRAVNTTYYNTTGKPIYFHAEAQANTVGQLSMSVTINGVVVSTDVFYTGATGYRSSENFIVPVGGAYSITLAGSAGSPTLFKWTELR